MTLENGARLGPYEIVELRGRGGMGEVYRARDTRLGRDVALKVLPAELSADQTFRKRFEREAKTISQLQHPHVCTLHDLGEQDGTDYLVLEYLDGETLEDRLGAGPLSLDELSRIGGQIAEAVEAAHRCGIVHRDLKPGNVMLTESGVKVLDFGLAREVLGPGMAVDTQAATMRDAITEEGRIVGTIPYMAPEQLKGKRRRRALGPLGAGLHPARDGDGGAPVRGSEPRRADRRDPGEGAGTAEPLAARGAGRAGSTGAALLGEGPRAAASVGAGSGGGTGGDRGGNALIGSGVRGAFVRQPQRQAARAPRGGLHIAGPSRDGLVVELRLAGPGW